MSEINESTGYAMEQQLERPSVAPLHDPSIVVIGYGNELRGDDAVGPRVADMVALWSLPGVCSYAVHQLTPELAHLLAETQCAIFVDAYRVERVHPHNARAAGDSRIVTENVEQRLPHDPYLFVRTLTPGAYRNPFGHIADPHELLSLSQLIYSRCPQAWQVGVPARQFTIGADLSPLAQEGMHLALHLIRFLIQKR